MKSFKQYITEEKESTLSHQMSGPLNDAHGNNSTEHSYHSTIPSSTSSTGNTNLWISHVVRPEGSASLPDTPHHELHFAVSDRVTPELFHRTRTEMESHQDNHVRENAKTPSEVLYSIPSERRNQKSINYHGPTTMIHVLRHMGTIISKIPKGHKILVTSDSTNPEDRERKSSAYMSMAKRLQREDLVDAHDFHGSVLMTRR